MSIASTIDINGNSVPSDLQINDLAFKAIRALYAEGAELRIMRMYLLNTADAIAKAHFDKYNLDVSAITADAAAAKTVAASVRSALDYENATSIVGYWQKFGDALKTAAAGMVDPRYVASYHAAVDPANATIAAATPAILATVASRATYRQAQIVAMPFRPMI